MRRAYSIVVPAANGLIYHTRESPQDVKMDVVRVMQHVYIYIYVYICVASQAVAILPGGHHTADNNECGHHTASTLTSWLGGHHTVDLASESTRGQAVTTPPAASNMYVTFVLCMSHQLSSRTSNLFSSLLFHHGVGSINRTFSQGRQDVLCGKLPFEGTVQWQGSLPRCYT